MSQTRQELQDSIPERIQMSAIHFDDKKSHVHQPFNIETGYVVAGFRHHNCYATLSAVFNDSDNEPWRRTRCDNETQGFLTNKNRFVNRAEAFEIATSQNQILDTENTRNGTLYSEDIY